MADTIGPSSGARVLPGRPGHSRHADEGAAEGEVEPELTYQPGDSTRPLHSLHCKNERLGHALLSATGTLGLGCLGSSVLPMPYAFSKTGVFFGFLLMVIVAYANAFTARLLLKAAAATNTDTYESCADAVGGRPWKVAVQVTLLALLFGNTCGSVSLLGDVGRLLMAHCEAVPALLPYLSAKGIQLALLLGLVFPLCLLRDIRSLDQCAPAAAMVVASLIAAVVYGSVTAGLPALRSGTLPVWIPTRTASLPEAVSLLGFAFYLHPCLIPVLREMPAGPTGLRATIHATKIVLFCICTVVYGTVGVFGAAHYGSETKGDILENHLLHGKLAVVLVGTVAAYLAVSIPPIFHVLRTSCRQIVSPSESESSFVRHFLETSVLLGLAFLVATSFADGAEKIFAITGSTGVCMACYVLPILIYRKERLVALERYHRQLGDEPQHGLAEAQELLIGPKPLLPPRQSTPLETLVSGLVLVVGVTTSALALYSSVSSST